MDTKGLLELHAKFGASTNEVRDAFAKLADEMVAKDVVAKLGAAMAKRSQGASMYRKVRHESVMDYIREVADKSGTPIERAIRDYVSVYGPSEETTKELEKIQLAKKVGEKPHAKTPTRRTAVGRRR